MSGESYTCPNCGRVSHHAMDVLNRFCGACKVFADDAPDAVLMRRSFADRFAVPKAAVGETIGLANPEAMNWLTFNPSGLRVNMKTGEVVIPEGLSLDAASREFWDGLGKLHPLAAGRELAAYLLGPEYRRLLLRALLARYATSSGHKAEHEKAIDLFEKAFPDVR